MKNILAVILLFICTLINADNHQDNSIKQMVSYQHQADKYMNDFDVNNAIPLYQKAIAIKASPTVVRNLAMCYFYRGYYKKSIDTEYVLTTDSFNHQDMKLMYNCYNNLMADSAYYWNKKIADKFLYDCDNIVKLAEYYNQEEMYDSTLVYTLLYNSKVDSTNMSVNREQAYAYYKKKDYGVAVREYTKLEQMGDHSMMTCFRKGLSYNGCDSLSQAYKYFKKAAEMSKMQNPNILIQLGMACIKVGEIDEGIDDLDLSLIKAGYNLDIMYTINNSIADGYLQKKNYKRCAYHLQQALLFRPNSYITIFKIAQIYGLTKDAANEKKYYQMFLANVADIGKPDDDILGLCKIADTRIAEIGKINVK